MCRFRQWTMVWLVVAVLPLAVGCGGEGETEAPTASLSEKNDPEAAGQAPAERAAPPPPRSDNALPVVRIDTSLGPVTVQLDRERTPQTVDNFLAYVERGFYDATVFHQVFDGYAVLAGSFNADLEPKDTRAPIFNEAHLGLSNRRGTIAMARDISSIDSATSTFFFNVRDNPELDHQDRTSPETYGYCAFGEVVEGMDVIDRIAGVAVHDTEQMDQTPVQTVRIESVRRLR